MVDVLCLSDCCADLVFEGLPSLPEPGGEVYGRRFSIRAGGGANTPMGLARLGCTAAYAATVGDDPLGRIVLSEMAQSGLDISRVRRAGAGGTWVSAVLATGGERSFASCAGQETDFRGAWLREAIEMAKRVHTYAYYAMKYPDIAACCRETGARLSLDFACDPALRLEDIAPLLRQAETITPNEAEACRLTGTGSAREALAVLSAYCAGTVITLGAEGCLAAVEGAAYQARPPRVEAESVNGAGDAFDAGLLYAGVRGLPAAERLRFACAAGALAVQCGGPGSEAFRPEAVRELAARVRVERLI